MTAVIGRLEGFLFFSFFSSFLFFSFLDSSIAAAFVDGVVVGEIQIDRQTDRQTAKRIDKEAVSGQKKNRYVR